MFWTYLDSFPKADNADKVWRKLLENIQPLIAKGEAVNIQYVSSYMLLTKLLRTGLTTRDLGDPALTEGVNVKRM